jgi:hypothetical protein
LLINLAKTERDFTTINIARVRVEPLSLRAFVKVVV